MHIYIYLYLYTFFYRKIATQYTHHAHQLRQYYPNPPPVKHRSPACSLVREYKAAAVIIIMKLLESSCIPKIFSSHMHHMHACILCNKPNIIFEDSACLVYGEYYYICTYDNLHSHLIIYGIGLCNALFTVLNPPSLCGMMM